MSLDPLTSLSSIKSELEHGWKLFDSVYDAFDARQWDKKFGKTWTYADQPWHLAYFDRTLAEYLTLGEKEPTGERLRLRSMGDLNEWNRRELATRGPNHTVKDSLAEMRRQRDVVRAKLASMSEEDLNAKAWMPLIFGWVTARDGGGCNISEGLPPRYDLQIVMKPENFHKLVTKMTPPPLLMLTGQMKIKGFGAMGTFAKMFPEPTPDQRIEISM
jgi:hypothetical protein